MRTIRYVKRGGRQIIVGFDELKIDPVATQEKVLAEMAESDVWQYIESDRAKLGEMDSPKKFKELLTAISLNRKIYAKQYRDAWDRHKIHFEPRKNELVVPETIIEDYIQLIKKLKPGEVLTTDGKVLRWKRKSSNE